MNYCQKLLNNIIVHVFMIVCLKCLTLIQLGCKVYQFFGMYVSLVLVGVMGWWYHL